MTATLTAAQSRALGIVPKICGTLSALFSLLIIITVLRDKSRLSKTYHRLLLCISIVDMNSGFWYSLSTWPIPSDSNILWSVGNNRTCTVQAFFLNMTITSSFYNASLTLYFLLVVRYGWKEHQLLKIEPYLHAIPLMWGFGTSFAALGLRIFGNASYWCWIKRSHDLYRWAFFYGPLWTMIVLVTTMSILIFKYVANVERTTMKYQHDVEKQFMNQFPSLSDEGKVSQQNVPTGGESSDTFDPAIGSGDNTTMANDTTSEEESSPYPSRSSVKFIVESRSVDDNRTDVHVSANLAKPNDIGIVQPPSPQQQPRRQSIIRRLSSRRLAKNDDDPVVRFKRTKQVASQCFWFAGAFYFNWLALSLARLLEAVNGKSYFPILLIAMFTTPLQGLPNVIVYLGPKYRELRKKFPHFSCWKLVCISVGRNHSPSNVVASSDLEMP